MDLNHEPVPFNIEGDSNFGVSKSIEISKIHNFFSVDAIGAIFAVVGAPSAALLTLQKLWRDLKYSVSNWSLQNLYFLKHHQNLIEILKFDIFFAISPFGESLGLLEAPWEGEHTVQVVLLDPQGIEGDQGAILTGF